MIHHFLHIYSHETTEKPLFFSFRLFISFCLKMIETSTLDEKSNFEGIFTKSTLLEVLKEKSIGQNPYISSLMIDKIMGEDDESRLNFINFFVLLTARDILKEYMK